MDAQATVLPFPVAPSGAVGPTSDYDRLRTTCPAAKVQVIGEVPQLDTTGWFVTRYQDVRALLADPRFIRPDVNDWPVTPPDWPPVEPDMTTMMEMTGTRHAILRKAVADAFNARAIRELAPRIREIADELLSEFLAGGSPGDLVAGFTEPFPIRVMCEVAGVPYEDRDVFVPLAEHLLFSVDLEDDDEDVTAVIRDLVVGWIERKRAEPGDDVLTDLLRRCDDGELSEQEVINFGRSMIIAGFLPSVMFLSNAVHMVLTDSGLEATLRAERELLPTAVDEFLRYLPVLNGNILLVATEDVTVAGQRVRAGELVIPVVASANLDGSAFRDADRFDPRRRHNPHLAFGRGEHNCLGAHLTRSKFVIAFEALFDRLPHLELADEVTWPDRPRKFRSPLALPVKW